MNNKLQKNRWGSTKLLSSFTKMFLITLMIISAKSISAQNSSVDLSGPSDFINLGNAFTTATNFSTNSVFTMETWVKLNSLAGYNTIFANRPSGSYERGYTFLLLDGKPYFEAYSSGSIAPTPIEANVWTHVAVVFNNGSCSFYINGVLVHSSSGVNVYPRSSTSALLGTFTNGWAGFNGSLDEFRVWNVARTQAQISSDMNHNTLCDNTGLLANFPFSENSGTSTSSTAGSYVGTLVNGVTWGIGVSTSPCAPTQTLTILGGFGTQGQIDPYTEASRDGGLTWQPAYLTGWHPWGFAEGTNSWINFDPSPFVGLNTTTDYRIRFTIPSDFSDPHMTFVLKADNRAWLSINDTNLGQFDGAASGAAGDQVIAQALRAGENEIRIRLQDFGGWVGLNYRIDLTMQSNEVPVLVPAPPPNRTPVANAGPDQTIDCTPTAGSEVKLNGSGSDADNDLLSYRWSNGVTTASQTLTLAPGTHTLTLTVNDGKGGTSSDDVIVTINADVTAPVPDVESLSIVTGECSAEITTIPTATDACGGTIVGTTSNPLKYTTQGTYTVKWTYIDANGNSSEQTQSVVVKDVTAPTITSTTQLLTLWSPNHKYETVKISDFGVSVTDNCANVSASSLIITKVTSDEPEDSRGNGDGNTVNDIVLAKDFKTVDLRKEREGTGNGRVYTIYVSVSDGNGNVGSANFQVQVPHDVKDISVNDGIAYEVLGGVVPVSASLANSNELEALGGDNISSNSIETESAPEGFELKQNYPNPFNPTTTISVAIPEAGYYTVKVFNTLGQEVAELINGQLARGNYSFKFDASKLSTGIYIYNVRGNNVNISRKMSLMK